VAFNVVFLEALSSGRMFGEALNFVEEALKSIPNKALHRPLLTWKAYCLAQVCVGSCYCCLCVHKAFCLVRLSWWCHCW
jgi:hypothetical protein